ncbi:BrnT family toxin [bacterium]|nr:BrnT family toxin [bacterium]
MLFEYDPEKSAVNKRKHGIDFEQAKAIWQDGHYLEIPADTEDEARYLVIGKIDDKWWSAVITYRSGSIRIISVRRSRKVEVGYYESENI